MQLELFLLEESGNGFKGGKKQRPFSMESGVVAVWGRHSKGSMSRRLRRRVGEGAARQRDRNEESRV